MASMTGYVWLVIGLSLILGMAGVNTLGGGTLDMMGVTISNSYVGNVSILGADNINTLSNPFLGSMLSIIVGLGIFGLSILSGKFSLGESLKLGVSGLFLTLIIKELGAVIATAQTLTSFSFLIQLIAYVIYIPMIGGVAIIIFNWVNGNN